MAQPTEVNGVIKVAVGDDTIPAARQIVVQALWAEGAAVVTDAGGNEIWEATAAGQGIEFPCGIELRGLNVTGTGPVFVYLKL